MPLRVASRDSERRGEKGRGRDGERVEQHTKAASPNVEWIGRREGAFLARLEAIFPQQGLAFARCRYIPALLPPSLLQLGTHRGYSGLNLHHTTHRTAPHRNATQRNAKRDKRVAEHAVTHTTYARFALCTAAETFPQKERQGLKRTTLPTASSGAFEGLLHLSNKGAGRLDTGDRAEQRETGARCGDRPVPRAGKRRTGVK